jgi:VWFA-related protein
MSSRTWIGASQDRLPQTGDEVTRSTARFPIVLAGLLVAAGMLGAAQSAPPPTIRQLPPQPMPQTGQQPPAQQPPAQQPSAQAPGTPAAEEPQAFKFRTGVELVNVNATVSDSSGRFVAGLTKDDFRVFDEQTAQTVTHFSAERVPVSLGILLDTSGSMAGEKIDAARAALERFLDLLNDPQDEAFLYRFDNRPQLVHGWTHDMRSISDSLAMVMPHGSTAMYDAVAEAMEMLKQAHNRKKALVIISDGNDTNSRTDVFTVKQMIRESEVLVYAVGIDAPADNYRVPDLIPGPAPAALQRGPVRVPMPFPMPGGGGRRPPSTPPQNPTSGHPYRGGTEDRVNVAALRDITDDSGGRTEIIRQPRDLDPVTAGIADELSKQYYLGYPAPGPKDGRWHAIRVEVRNPSYHVRARTGYVAAR